MVGTPNCTRTYTLSLQGQTNMPSLHTRLHATTVVHLGKVLRREHMPLLTKQIQKTFSQDGALFTRRTRAFTTANTINT